MDKLIQTSGKRKRAVARATVRPGKGRVRLNGELLSLVKPEIAQLRLQEPLILAGDVAGKVDIDIITMGGGWSGQIESARLAVARALLEYTKDEKLEKKYLTYDRSLLVADTRYKEKKKPNTHSNARAKRQKSYR